MESCKISVENNNKIYIGKYEIKDNILTVSIENYPYSFDDFGKMEYKAITIKDFDKRVFIYSPKFYSVGVKIDSIDYVKFKTDFYFESDDFKNIDELNKDIKVKAIKFGHPLLKEFFNNESLSLIRTDEYYQYTLKTKGCKKEININKNNISKLIFNSNCYFNCKGYGEKIEIETKNFITLCLINEIKYEEVINYIQEMNVYLNAYYPVGLKTCETYIATNNGNSFKLVHKYLEQNNYSGLLHCIFIKDKFFEFMKKMYTNANYRISINKNNFLPLEFKVLPSLEDEFLFYFRYINQFIGNKLVEEKLKDEPNAFDCIENFIENNKDLFNKTDLNREYFKNEINSLRNHYVHEGYYLPNNQFKVKERRRVVDIKTMDYNWLYDITKSLKCGVYRMLYKEFLGLNIDEKNLFMLIKTMHQ